MKRLSKKAYTFFLSIFGVTSIDKRIRDIIRNCFKYFRYGTHKAKTLIICNIFTSALVMLYESGITPEEAVDKTINNIKQNKDWYIKYGRKRKIAIIGISGNMTHKGHINTANYLIKMGIVDEVWFMLANENLAGKLYEKTRIRKKILELSVASNKYIKVLPIEIDLDLGGETHHSLNKLFADKRFQGKYEFVCPVFWF